MEEVIGNTGNTEDKNVAIFDLEDMLNRANVDNAEEIVEIINKASPKIAFLFGVMLEYCRYNCGKRILITDNDDGCIHMRCYTGDDDEQRNDMP